MVADAKRLRPAHPVRGWRLLHPVDGPGVHDRRRRNHALLPAITLLGAILIKNRLRPRSTAVIMVAQLPLFLFIASITSLGNTFIPFLWAIVIAAHHMLSPRSSRPRP